jgi:hypothetical protein
MITLVPPRKGSTSIGMIPACCGVCGSTAEWPDTYAVPARRLARRSSAFRDWLTSGAFAHWVGAAHK